MLSLLDLSTKADLFGVQLEPGRDDDAAGTLPETGFVGLSLAVSDAMVAVFAVPALSWEPMVDDASTPPGEILAASPATDGVPTLLIAPGIAPTNEQTLVPLAPVPVLLRTIGNVAAGPLLRLSLACRSA